MATVAAEARARRRQGPARRVAARIVRVRRARLPLHIFLAVHRACSGWCRRSGSSSRRCSRRATSRQNGWWKVISQPHLATWANYSNVWNNTEHPARRCGSTAEIAIGGTVLPIIIAALAGYAFAWLEFPGRDWLFIVVIALLVVPLQMALIPIFHALQHARICTTRCFGLILFHTAFGLPFAIFLLRNFFIGIPKDILESARIDGASEIRIFLRADPAARPAGDRVARDLPVPLDVERPAGRADDGAQHAADHRRRSSRSCASSARTSTSSRRRRSCR